MSVHFTRAAVGQIREILAYVSEENPKTADRIAERFQTVTELILARPQIGRPTNRGNVRVFRINPYPYLIFYRIHGRERAHSITVMKVRHTAQSGDWRAG